MMNKLVILLLSACCLLMTACDKENDETAQGFRIMNADVDLAAGGGTVEVALQATGELTAVSGADWMRLMDTNIGSVYNCCHFAIPHMVHEKCGKIINISSVWGIAGASCEAAYSASKGAVNALTRALAKELAPSNIQVNAIACGAIDTDMNAFLSEDERASLIEEIPAGRLGTPAEVGSLVQSLCSDSGYLTGQVIQLDGGWI